MSKSFSVLCFGDVIGKYGRQALRAALPGLRERYAADLVIANGENAAGGVGFDEKCAVELRDAGVDIITLGDHRWDRNGNGNFLAKPGMNCIRPANIPGDAAGDGFFLWQKGNGPKVGVFNLLGRVFTQALVDCPFRKADELLSAELHEAEITILDMHAEATSEKQAIFWFLDGRLSLGFGTHTHVQTADERLLPKGTACISDLGMCGVAESVIGMDPATAVRRFTSGVSAAYKIAGGEATLRGIHCCFEEIDGKYKAAEIQRISFLPKA